MSQISVDIFCWLIEFNHQPNTPTQYIEDFESGGGAWRQTKDAFLAKRFATKELAEAHASSLTSIDGQWYVCEHGFYG